MNFVHCSSSTPCHWSLFWSKRRRLIKKFSDRGWSHCARSRFRLERPQRGGRGCGGFSRWFRRCQEPFLIRSLSRAQRGPWGGPCPQAVLGGWQAHGLVLYRSHFVGLGSEQRGREGHQIDFRSDFENLSSCVHPQIWRVGRTLGVAVRPVCELTLHSKLTNLSYIRGSRSPQRYFRSNLQEQDISKSSVFSSWLLASN